MLARLICRGCGQIYELQKDLILACENRGDNKDTNHILEKVIDVVISKRELISSKELNPFIKFKDFFYSHDLAKKLNLNYNEIVKKIDPGFMQTPLIRDENLFIKNETSNVGGSHKARHLMGTAIYLEVLGQKKPELFIKFCGIMGPILIPVRASPVKSATPATTDSRKSWATVPWHFPVRERITGAISKEGKPSILNF